MMKVRKQKSEPEYSAINPARTRSAQKQPFFIRFYALIALLVVTLALIGVVIYLHRTLPDGAQSQYKLPFAVKRSIEERHVEVVYYRRERTSQREKAIRDVLPNKRAPTAPTVPNPWLPTAVTFTGAPQFTFDDPYLNYETIEPTGTPDASTTSLLAIFKPLTSLGEFQFCLPGQCDDASSTSEEQKGPVGYTQVTVCNGPGCTLPVTTQTDGLVCDSNGDCAYPPSSLTLAPPISTSIPPTETEVITTSTLSCVQTFCEGDYCFCLDPETTTSSAACTSEICDGDYCFCPEPETTTTSFDTTTTSVPVETTTSPSASCTNLRCSDYNLKAIYCWCEDETTTSSSTSTITTPTSTSVTVTDTTTITPTTPATTNSTTITPTTPPTTNSTTITSTSTGTSSDPCFLVCDGELDICWCSISSTATATPTSTSIIVHVSTSTESTTSTSTSTSIIVHVSTSTESTTSMSTSTSDIVHTTTSSETIPPNTNSSSTATPTSTATSMRCADIPVEWRIYYGCPPVSTTSWSETLTPTVTASTNSSSTVSVSSTMESSSTVSSTIDSSSSLTATSTTESSTITTETSSTRSSSTVSSTQSSSVSTSSEIASTSLSTSSETTSSSSSTSSETTSSIASTSSETTSSSVSSTTESSTVSSEIPSSSLSTSVSVTVTPTATSTDSSTSETTATSSDPTLILAVASTSSESVSSESVTVSTASTSEPVTPTTGTATTTPESVSTSPTPSPTATSELSTSPTPLTSSQTVSSESPTVSSPTTTATQSTSASLTTPTTSASTTMTTQTSASSSVKTALEITKTVTGGAGATTPTGSADPITVITWPVARSFVGSFAPLIAARAFVNVFSAAYHQVAFFEPVRQLLSDSGASGAALAGSAITLAPIIFTSFFVDISSAVASEAVFLDTHYCDNPVFENTVNPCWPPRISTNKWALDILIGGLALVAATLVYVIALWLKTPNRISAETTTISGVATIMGHPQVDHEFGNVPTEMTHNELAQYLKDKQYTLGTFPHETAGEKYGIMPVVMQHKRKSIIQRLEGSVVESKASTTVFKDWTRSRLYSDIAFGVFLLALLGLTMAAVASVDDPRRVFVYNTREATIGFRVAFAIIGILVARYWCTLFQDAQNFAQYARLHLKPSSARSTINKKGYSLPLFGVFPLIRLGYLIPASVAFTALLAEFFVIALSGLPYRPGQLRGEFIFCGTAAAVMLVCMLIVLGLVIYWRSTLPHMPRRPDSVAAVMTYVAGTGMVRDFEGLENTDRKARDKRIESLGKRYGYGLRMEEDGRKRWVVDEVGMGYENERRRAQDDQTWA